MKTSGLGSTFMFPSRPWWFSERGVCSGLLCRHETQPPDLWDGRAHRWSLCCVLGMSWHSPCPRFCSRLQPMVTLESWSSKTARYTGRSSHLFMFLPCFLSTEEFEDRGRFWPLGYRKKWARLSWFLISVMLSHVFSSAGARKCKQYVAGDFRRPDF